MQMYIIAFSHASHAGTWIAIIIGPFEDRKLLVAREFKLKQVVARGLVWLFWIRDSFVDIFQFLFTIFVSDEIM